MPDPELLPPPPPKSKQQPTADGGLLPPPPKKKENGGSRDGAISSGDGLSNTQTVEPDYNSYAKGLGKTGFDNVLNVEGAEPIKDKDQGFKDLSVRDFTSRKTKAGFLPNISDYAVKDNTINVQPDITGNHIDYVQHNEERKQKHEKLVEEAIKNTAEKYLKNQGVIVTDEDRKGSPEKLVVAGKPFGEKEVVSKNSTLYNQTLQKYREAYQNGDATFAIDKDGTVGLNRTIGPIEGLTKGWNNATKEADFNQDFIHNMNDEERVAVMEKRMAQNEHPEYLGERGSTAGSIAQWGAEQAPFLAKAGLGYALGATVAAAAPATAGASLVGAPIAMSFLATANDMANSGAANEVQRRYAILRHDNPNGDKVEQMQQAYKGGLVGGVAGIATNALLMGMGGDAATNVLKQSISNEGKSVIKNTLKNIYKSSVHMGNVGAAIEGSKQAIGAMEGVHTIPTEVARDMANSWSENAKTGALLTGVMSAGAGLPKVLVSAFKYALKDTPKDVIKATLKFNEDNGIIPKGVTDNVIADLQSYDNALAQVPKGLSPEAQASMAGLIEKQTKLQEELKGKHKVANADLEIKIKAIDEQIAKINETGKPFSAEIDEMSGEKYTQRTPEEKNGVVVTPPQSFPEPITIGEKNESTTAENGEPIQEVTEQQKGQEAESGIPASTEPIGQGESKPADAVLDKVYYRGQPDSELPNKDIFITPNEGMGTMYKGKDGTVKKMNLSATNLFDMDTIVTKDFNDKLADAWKKANVGGDYKNETPQDIKDGSFVGKTYAQIHKEMPMFRRALEEMGYEGIENNFSHLKLEKNPRQEIIVFDKKHLHEIVGDSINKPNETTSENKVPDTTKEKSNTEELVDKPVGGAGEGGGQEPPKVTEIATDNNDEGWTAIRKVKQKEIKAFKDSYESQKVKGWSETMQKGLEKTAKLHPDKTLYDGAMSVMHDIKAGLGHGDLTTDEALATMQYLKREIGAKRSRLAESVTSDNDMVRQSAILQDEALGEDYANAALAAKDITTTAGRTLNYAQSEIRLDPEHGLQIRRMQLMKAKGGDKLSADEMKWTEEKWKQEQEINKQEEAIRSQEMQDAFDKKIADLQKEYEAKLKEAGTKTSTPKTPKEKTLSQKGKNVADRIRNLKKPKGGTNLDFTLGTWDLAVEGIAKLVEAGATIAEAIDKLIKDSVIGFKEAKDREEFENYIAESLPEKKGKSEILNDIKEFAKEAETEEITNDMVGKGLIRDYVNSHIGDVEQADILDVAAKDLKEVLPNATKEKLIEAYLKENEFKQPTKKDLEGGIAEAKKQLNSIAKLTEDIEDLNGLKSIRQRTFPNERAKSEAEKALFDEKAAKVKEIKERRNAILADNKKVQDEANRQLSIVNDLKEKKAKLEKGIIEKQAAKEKVQDTPEIEKLKKEVAELKKAILKEESDRNAAIKKGNRIVESETNRQMTRVNDLKEKIDKLENGIREKREVIQKKDTPEIEALKDKAKDTDKKLREAESLAKKMADDLQKKKDKLDEMNAGIKRAEQGYDQIKTHRNKSEAQIDEEIAKKQKELKNSIRDNATEEQQQKKALEDAIKNQQEKINEFTQKLADGEFVDPEPVVLKKKTANLIALEKQRALIEEQYRKKQSEVLGRKESMAEKVAKFVRSTYVISLISSPKTLLKVGAMSVLRPMSEAARKATLNKVFDSFFPNISKAAKLGGESSSVKSIQKGFQAYFKQMGSDKLEAMYKKAGNDYISATDAYNSYKESSNPDPKKLEALKNDMNDKLINAQGSFIYQFIGGSSLKDAWGALVHRHNEIEKQFGHVEGENFKDGNALDKTSYALGFIGRSHSALKTFSGRFSFAAGFMARLEGAVAKGEDISSKEKIIEIAHESYLDWERGKYQQSNLISDLWNTMVNKLTQGKRGDELTAGKVAQYLLKTDVAITRVPVNILHEAVVEYSFGLVKAAYMAAKEVNKIKGGLKDEGILKKEEGYKQALREKISQMDAKQAATIVRCFSKGGLGVGLYATALIIGGMRFGIFPHMGQKKKKEEEDLKPDELNPGQVMFGDKKLGEVSSATIEHIPALFPLFMGLGLAEAYHDKIKAGETTSEAAASAIYTHLKILEHHIPQTKLIEGVEDDAIKNVERRLTDMGVIKKEEFKGFTDKQLQSDGIAFIKEKKLKLSSPQKRQADKTLPNYETEEQYNKFLVERANRINDGLHQLKEKGLRGDDESREAMQSAIDEIVEFANKDAKRSAFGVKEKVHEVKGRVRDFVRMPVEH